MMLTTNMYYISCILHEYSELKSMTAYLLMYLLLEQSKNDYVLSDVRMHKLYLKTFMI